jgi:hypothetical protein
MIILMLALLAQDPPPLTLTPFMDEKSAAHALEEQMRCLASGAFERRNDGREASIVASVVVHACSDKAADLRAALTDVYRRKPALIPAGNSPGRAADAYVGAMNSRVELVILDERKHK